jgi:hypothetical protein
MSPSMHISMAVVSRMFGMFPTVTSYRKYKARPSTVNFSHPPNEHHARPPSSYQCRSPLRWGRDRWSPGIGPASDPRVHLVGAKAVALARQLSDATTSRAIATGPPASLFRKTSSATSWCRRTSGGKHSKMCTMSSWRHELMEAVHGNPYDATLLAQLAQAV